MTRAELAPLFELRLRTPRLELRLGSRDELAALGRLARRGIHPPGEMPFAVAWTDGAGEPGFVDEFVAFHEQALGAWSPHEWTLSLLAFQEGDPVGTQGVGAKRFAAERVVTTGSWLGREHQGRGLGTEMRAAVLELAFGPLRAAAARSGWLESGAGQSAGVSAKLGYREVGVHAESPRGEPVPHHDLRLERHEWRCPIHVEITGAGPCLPLFGLGAS